MYLMEYYIFKLAYLKQILSKYIANYTICIKKWFPVQLMNGVFNAMAIERTDATSPAFG